jgi:hypothetical protein
MTFVRFSSMPNADTLVMANGSTSHTQARSALPPPQPSTSTGMPALTLTASDASNSTMIS